MNLNNLYYKLQLTICCFFYESKQLFSFRLLFSENKRSLVALHKVNYNQL